MRLYARANDKWFIAQKCAKTSWDKKKKLKLSFYEITLSCAGWKRSRPHHFFLHVFHRTTVWRLAPRRKIKWVIVCAHVIFKTVFKESLIGVEPSFFRLDHVHLCDWWTVFVLSQGTVIKLQWIKIHCLISDGYLPPGTVYFVIESLIEITFPCHKISLVTALSVKIFDTDVR